MLFFFFFVRLTLVFFFFVRSTLRASSTITPALDSESESIILYIYIWKMPVGSLTPSSITEWQNWICQTFGWHIILQRQSPWCTVEQIRSNSLENQHQRRRNQPVGRRFTGVDMLHRIPILWYAWSLDFQTWPKDSVTTFQICSIYVSQKSGGQ